jgi:hypothetical protein
MTAAGQGSLDNGRTRTARAKGWAVGTGVVALWVLYRAVVGSMSDSTVRDVLTLFGDVILCSSVAFGLRAYARGLPSAGVIVWLRKFDVRQSTGFGAVLERAARGVGHPMTLQDASYSASLSSAAVRAPLLIPLLGTLSLFGALLLAVLVFAVFGSGSEVMIILVLLGFAIAVWRAGGAWLRRVGFRTVSSDEAKRELAQALRERGKGRWRPVLGVEVLKVADDGWQELVHQGLAGAALAIVDVTKITENIRWELATAVTLLGPSRVILAAEQNAASPERIWREAGVSAQQSGGVQLDSKWVTSALFTYSPARSSVATPTQRNDANALRRMMLERLPR